jgi:hypothetical protein
MYGNELQRLYNSAAEHVKVESSVDHTHYRSSCRQCGENPPFKTSRPRNDFVCCLRRSKLRCLDVSILQ